MKIGPPLEAPITVTQRKRSKISCNMKYLAPVLGLVLFVVTLAVLLATGTAKDRAVSISLILGATVAWLDTRALGLEVTSLCVLIIPVVSQTLPFSAALGGASSSSIWLIWVGSVAGTALDRCQVSDWLVRMTTHGMSAQPSLLNLLTRVAILTFAASMTIPSAVVRNLMLVPLGARLKERAKLSAERAEALTALLIFGATKSGLGLLTGYVTAMLVAGVYQQTMSSPDLAGHPAPATLGWATYAGAILPIWGVLIMPVLLLSVYGVYRPLELAVEKRDQAERERALKLASKRLRAPPSLDGGGGGGDPGGGDQVDGGSGRQTPRWNSFLERAKQSGEAGGPAKDVAAAAALARMSAYGIDPLQSTVKSLRALLAKEEEEEEAEKEATAAAGKAWGSSQAGARSASSERTASSRSAAGSGSGALQAGLDGLILVRGRLEEMPGLSPAGKRAMCYLLAAILAWALLGGTFESVRLDRGAVGLILVVLLYAPPPVGVADPIELRTSRSYGVIIYLVSVICLNATITRAGLTAELAALLNTHLDLDALSPMMQYCVISWSLALLTVPTNEVLACVIGTSVWLQFATSASYAGPLTPVRVALACACPGALCLTPTHCPPAVVGLALSRGPGGTPVQTCRLYTMMALQTVAEVLILTPLSAAIIANYG